MMEGCVIIKIKKTILVCDKEIFSKVKYSKAHEDKIYDNINREKER